MSGKFKKVKEYFDRGFWTAEMVRNAVLKGWITEEEFQEITGIGIYEVKDKGD